MIFLFPLAFCLIAGFMFVTGDYSLGTKVTVAMLVLASIAMQFVSPLPQMIHFLVPLFLQLIICGWWYFASQFE